MNLDRLTPQERDARSSFAQQVPERPGVPPGNTPSQPAPPTQPDIPAPDPPPPPVENPGDVPLPPITDPDVVVPGDPSPTQPPLKARPLA
ncbi:hypothetical protein [Methylocapsa palsarum]|uniref:hypothetical protein n=1 Tax=Methylocapsa palsarum TaxID=1612308 RepID=UPI001113DDFE|nr:hypothetical protein [Methylocapsa palsarum]